MSVTDYTVALNTHPTKWTVVTPPPPPAHSIAVATEIKEGQLCYFFYATMLLKGAGEPIF